jgi:hypothetical protein
MQGKKKAKENEREKLFQVKRKKCVQKEFDRADMVRDGAPFMQEWRVTRHVGARLVLLAEYKSFAAP